MLDSPHLTRNQAIEMSELLEQLKSALADRYVLERELGSGGMATVYLAHDVKHERQVALKVLAPDLAASSERLDRFQREAEILAALDHPNIVTVFSVERDGDVHFLTMQLVEGARLSDTIPPGGMPLARLLEIAVPLVDAVAAAHARGVTHRDLKPANVMVDGEGQVRLTDFGLAVAAGAGAESGTLAGTPQYMAPEQLSGGELTKQTDIYALGLVLYEMLAGSRWTRRTTAPRRPMRIRPTRTATESATRAKRSRSRGSWTGATATAATG